MLAQLARQVDAFAKGLQAENDGAHANLHALAVLFKQLGARTHALSQHLLYKILGQCVMAGLHHLVLARPTDEA